MLPTSMDKPPTVIMACPGVGKVRRGFERMFEDLFALVADDAPVILYKGGGDQSANQVVLPFIHRNSRLLRVFPVHKLLGRTAIHIECFTFALALLWTIRGQSVDVIHTIDPPLARFLYKIRERFKLRFRLLYTEGCAMPPTDYPPCDHLHQISEATYNEAKEAGIPSKFMTLLPLGIYPERFESQDGKLEARQRWKIPQDLFVICAVSAINRYHKRIDYLVDECAQLTRPFLLWIDGSLDQGDPDLIDYAKSLLGDRVRVTHVESNEVRDIYRCSDLMVHTSVFEAFGLAMVEAASTGLPVLTHNGPHYRWLTGESKCNLDMREHGNLQERLDCLMSDPNRLDALSIRGNVMPRFSWRALRGQYISLYEKVWQLSDEHIGIADDYGLK